MHCGSDCKSFLGGSARLDGMGLCSNPDYLMKTESCLSIIGRQCEYFVSSENAGSLVQHNSDVEITSTAERRAFPRQNIYASVLIEVKGQSGSRRTTGIAVDLSKGGMAVILPNESIFSFDEKSSLSFDLVVRPRADTGAHLQGHCCYIEEYNHSVHIGLSFADPISDKTMVSLLHGCL